MANPFGILLEVDGQERGSINVNRPSWSELSRNYPAEKVSVAAFAAMVGKSYATLVRDMPDFYQNTCATRMSYALNRSGLRLPVAPNGGSIKGDDGFNYWLRVSQLKEKLKSHFGKADHELKFDRIDRLTKTVFNARLDKARNFLDQIRASKGIVVFEVTGWKDATGHFTLWDGQDLLYCGEGRHNDPSSAEYYFWFCRLGLTDKVAAQTIKVLFWGLK